MLNNKRLSIMVRKNAGREILPRIIDESEKILGRKVSNDDFLPLIESDAIREHFYEVFKTQDSANNLKRLVSFNQDDILTWMKNNFSIDVHGYLFFRDSDKIGGLNITLKEFISSPLNFLYLDGDSVFFISKCNKIKLYLTYYEDDSSESEYEVISLV